MSNNHISFAGASSHQPIQSPDRRTHRPRTPLPRNGSPSDAASTSAESSNNHSWMLSHRDSLTLHTHYGRTPKPPSSRNSSLSTNPALSRDGSLFQAPIQRNLHYRGISPDSASHAASTSIERSNNYRAMLSHKDSLNLRSRYDHAANLPLRDPELRAPKVELWEKLSKIKDVVRRALQKRLHKLAQRGKRTMARETDVSSLTGTVRRIPVGSKARAGAKTHHSSYHHHHHHHHPQPTPQPSVPIPTPIYDAHRQRRTNTAPQEFYQAWAIVKQQEAEEEAAKVAKAAVYSPPPLAPRKPLPQQQHQHQCHDLKPLPPIPLPLSNHHHILSHSDIHHHARHTSTHGHICTASTSTATYDPNRFSTASTVSGITCPPTALQNSVRRARATQADLRAAAQVAKEKARAGGGARVTRVSDFIHAYSPDRSAERRPVSLKRQNGNGKAKGGDGGERKRCGVCGLAVPYTAAAHEGLAAGGVWLCPGCRVSGDGVSGREVAPVTEVHPALREEGVGVQRGSPKKVERKRASSTAGKGGAGWRCEHCSVGLVRGVKKGGLCLCPICGGEIKGKERESRFVDVEGVYDVDVDEIVGSRRESRRSESRSPVSPIGEGKFDKIVRRESGKSTRRMSLESRQSWESAESGSTSFYIPGLDTGFSGATGPNLHLAYEYPETPPMSSAATTEIDLRLPQTPPQAPPRVSSKVGYLKSKTKQRQEAQYYEQPKKAKHVASSIYPAHETEKDFYTSDKPLPGVPRDSVVTQRRVSPELTPAEMEAISNLPPLSESNRNSGIWPMNEPRATLPAARRSSFYGFYKPILEN